MAPAGERPGPRTPDTHACCASVRPAIHVRIGRDATGEGLGAERQRSACEALATARGWHVVETITENDVSATKGDRTGAGIKLATVSGDLDPWAELGPRRLGS